MKELTCETIRDVLPLYVDDVVSTSTKELISEHLAGCDSCRKILDEMKQTISIPVENDCRPLKKIKRKLVVQRLLIACISAIATAAALFGLLWVPIVRVPYGESTRITTEIQQKDGNYLDQEFVMHIHTMGGVNVDHDLSYVFEEDSTGKSTVTGVILSIKEPIITVVGHAVNWDFHWGYDEDSDIDSDFDFTVTVEFRDSAITYSLRDMGLFNAQKNRNTT